MPEAVLQAKMKAMSRIAALRTRLSIANEKLVDQANRDGLTGLLNRRAMDQQVDRLWEQALASAKPFALLMIDVDNFKKYNDQYGHLAGDECLRSVAACLDQVVQMANVQQLAPGAFAARYGGEEFAVIVPNPQPNTHCDLANRLVTAVAALDIAHEKNGDYGKVTISIGSSRIDPATGQIKHLFRQADQLLYKAKASGRNRAEWLE
jgi:diguanylate cyclase (GGDEF)-like protein